MESQSAKLIDLEKESKPANLLAWFWKLISHITLFCDNSGAVAQSKDLRNHKKGKHIERKYHIIQDIVAWGDVVVAKIDSANNLADPFTKALPQRTFESHLEGMGVRLVHNSL